MGESIIPNYVVQHTKPLPTEVKIVCAMAVYNRDRIAWLVQAIDSVLTQTLPVGLFIIVLDGEVSSDIALYLQKIEKNNANVVLMHGLACKGLSSSMNFAIDWSIQFSPKYFFRMDADDICFNNRFAVQTELLDKYPGFDILGSSLIEINEQGKQVGQRKLPVKHTDLISSFSRRCPINHPTVVIRYNVFEKGFRYKEQYMNTQDYFFWVDLAKAGFHFANIKQPLLQFRRINGFYKRRGRLKSINEFKARMYAMKHLKQTNIINLIYAVCILTVRLMPSFVIKFAYTVDRVLMKKFGKH